MLACDSVPDSLSYVHPFLICIENRPVPHDSKSFLQVRWATNGATFQELPDVTNGQMDDLTDVCVSGDGEHILLTNCELNEVLSLQLVR